MNNQFPRYQITPDYSISRLIKGHWQLSEGHLQQGSHDEKTLLKDMRSFVEAGITTFDMADIYTGTEELVGRFLKENKTDFINGDLPPVQIHTKYVPDLNRLSDITIKDTENIVDRSLQRLGVDTLDMVQFHWWNYEVPRYIEVAHHLKYLQEKGKIRHLGVTNFNTDILQELLDSGLNIISMQTQYSVLDRRPEKTMIDLCKKNNISLFCYGTLSGGFVNNKYLNTDQFILETAKSKNRSLTKYSVVIEDMGWESYQKILQTLEDVSQHYGVNTGEVAVAYILSRDTVGGTIVGAYSQSHLDRLSHLKNLQLSEDDKNKIRNILLTTNTIKGDCFEAERYQQEHKNIMKFNLNDSRSS